MKLITETIQDFELLEATIVESADGKKSYYISGPFINTEVQNRNGRFYPKFVIESQLDRQFKLIKDNRALGELNHPNSPIVNPDRACHVIKELKWSGNDVVGKAKILDENRFPCARTVMGLIDEGIKFGVSTRGVGSVKKNSRGVNEVQNDFRLICVDTVLDPSGPTCFVGGIMENVNWVYDSITDSFIEQKVEEIKEEIDSAVRSGTLDTAKKMKLFETYLNALTKRVK